MYFAEDEVPIVYYIYGNQIAVQKETKPNYFPMRHKITAQEIYEAYPTDPDLIVKLFKTEEDVLKYCNALDKRYTSGSAILYLRPFYLVHANEILENDWIKTTIEYEELQYTKKQYPTVKSMWDTSLKIHSESIETLDVRLSVLSPIKGEIKDKNDRVPITGSVNFQTYNKSFCRVM